MAGNALNLDSEYALDHHLGKEGISASDLEACLVQIRQTHQQRVAQSKQGQFSFYDLPETQKEAQTIEQRASELRKRFDTLVVLGIGGSALGTRALLNALRGIYVHELILAEKQQGARVYVCDTLDPDLFSQLLETLDWEKTVFNVISKSGGTLETLSQFQIVREIVEQKVGSAWPEHFVFTTDPESGFLRKIARQWSIATFEIPPGVGGRFSVLTAVGLFPAAFAGIDIQALLQGASQLKRELELEDFSSHPAILLASLAFLFDQKGKNLFVLMPYSERLFAFAEWFAQLWAESLGKRFSLDGQEKRVGSTPVVACGPRDQHSQLQLYQEGPRDKFILFFKIQEFSSSLKVPVFDPFQKKYFENFPLDILLNAEARGTAFALAEGGVPSATLSIPSLSPHSIGALFFLFEMATIYAGGLYQVNPYDQPGVEQGKKITEKILGEKGKT